MMNPYEIERHILALERYVKDLDISIVKLHKKVNGLEKEILALGKKLGTKSKTS